MDLGSPILRLVIGNNQPLHGITSINQWQVAAVGERVNNSVKETKFLENISDVSCSLPVKCAGFPGLCFSPVQMAGHTNIAAPTIPAYCRNLPAKRASRNFVQVAGVCVKENLDR